MKALFALVLVVTVIGLAIAQAQPRKALVAGGGPPRQISQIAR